MSKVIKVFHGQAIIDGSPTYTWMCGNNNTLYTVERQDSWINQEQAIEKAKEMVGPGGIVEVYSQSGQFKLNVVVEGRRQESLKFGKVKSSPDGSSVNI